MRKLFSLMILLTATITHAAVIKSDINNNTQYIEWNISRGNWTNNNNTLSNTRYGENRIFTNALNLGDNFTVEFDANLAKGKGWGFYFNSSLDSRNKVTGYNFQFDPGYGKGAYLLRGWNSNRESVIDKQMQNLDTGNYHHFKFDITANSFTAFQDGIEILSFEGDLSSHGSLMGFRTWSNSQAHFKNMQVYSSDHAVPEPASAAILLFGGLYLHRKTRRTRTLK